MPAPAGADLMTKKNRIKRARSVKGDRVLSRLLVEIKRSLEQLISADFQLSLFGSRARGNPEPDSDVDLMLSIPDEKSSLELENKIGKRRHFLMSKVDQVKLLIANSEESIHAAGELYENEHYNFSASRAYYAFFYAAEAVLLHRDLQFSKHPAVLAYFNKGFIKQGTWDRQMFKSFQKARELLDSAKLFVARIKEYLIKEGYKF